MGNNTTAIGPNNVKLGSVVAEHGRFSKALGQLAPRQAVDLAQANVKISG